MSQNNNFNNDNVNISNDISAIINDNNNGNTLTNLIRTHSNTSVITSTPSTASDIVSNIDDITDLKDSIDDLINKKISKYIHLYMLNKYYKLDCYKIKFESDNFINDFNNFVILLSICAKKKINIDYYYLYAFFIKYRLENNIISHLSNHHLSNRKIDNEEYKYYINLAKTIPNKYKKVAMQMPDELVTQSLKDEFDNHDLLYHKKRKLNDNIPSTTSIIQTTNSNNQITSNNNSSSQSSIHTIIRPVDPRIHPYVESPQAQQNRLSLDIPSSNVSNQMLSIQSPPPTLPLNLNNIHNVSLNTQKSLPPVESNNFLNSPTHLCQPRQIVKPVQQQSSFNFYINEARQHQMQFPPMQLQQTQQLELQSPHYVDQSPKTTYNAHIAPTLHSISPSSSIYSTSSTNNKVSSDMQDNMRTKKYKSVNDERDDDIDDYLYKLKKENKEHISSSELINKFTAIINKQLNCKINTNFLTDIAVSNTNIDEKKLVYNLEEKNKKLNSVPSKMNLNIIYDEMQVIIKNIIYSIFYEICKKNNYNIISNYTIKGNFNEICINFKDNSDNLVEEILSKEGGDYYTLLLIVELYGNIKKKAQEPNDTIQNINLDYLVNKHFFPAMIIDYLVKLLNNYIPTYANGTPRYNFNDFDELYYRLYETILNDKTLEENIKSYSLNLYFGFFIIMHINKNNNKHTNLHECLIFNKLKSSKCNIGLMHRLYIAHCNFIYEGEKNYTDIEYLEILINLFSYYDNHLNLHMYKMLNFIWHKMRHANLILEIVNLIFNYKNESFYIFKYFLAEYYAYCDKPKIDLAHYIYNDAIKSSKFEIEFSYNIVIYKMIKRYFVFVHKYKKIKIDNSLYKLYNTYIDKQDKRPTANRK